MVIAKAIQCDPTIALQTAKNLSKSESQLLAANRGPMVDTLLLMQWLSDTESLNNESKLFGLLKQYHHIICRLATLQGN